MDALDVLRLSYESMLGRLSDEQWRELVAMVVRRDHARRCITVASKLSDNIAYRR